MREERGFSGPGVGEREADNRKERELQKENWLRACLKNVAPPASLSLSGNENAA